MIGIKPYVIVGTGGNYSRRIKLKKNFFNFLEYSRFTMLYYAIQQSDLIIHIYIHIPFHILFHCGLSQGLHIAPFGRQ